VSGDTEQRYESPVEQEQPTQEQEQTEQMEGLTLNEPAIDEAPQEKNDAAAESDNESQTSRASRTSYQATVEDDFEDLGAEVSSSASQPSTPVEKTPKEPKGKERAVEQPDATETAVHTAPQPEVPAQQRHQQPEYRELLSERVHGSFERTFQFPERIDMANVTASMKNGVLSLTVPKAPKFQTRRITIQ
jgi:hypothetical protein